MRNTTAPSPHPLRKSLRTLQLLLTLLATLAAVPAQAQRMPQDSWYLAKEFNPSTFGGLFANPGRAAFGPDGCLYVTDRGNNNIQVFDTDGNFIRTWGSGGGGNGQFQDPVGIAISSEGTVYVCEWNGHRIQVFDAQGKFIRTFGSYGNGDGQLNGPHGVALDSSGNVYVLEYISRRISVFSPTGTFLRSWGAPGSADGQFNGPIGICRTADNNIAVLEREGSRIQVFSTTGVFKFKFGAYGYADADFNNNKNGLDSDSAGNFYVSSHYGSCVSVFSPTGTFLRAFGQSGSEDGQCRYPFGLAVQNGKSYVCDYSGSRIAIFDASGVWVKNFGSRGNPGVGDMHGIVADSFGNLFVSDYQHNAVRKFDSQFNVIKTFGTTGTGDGQFNSPLELAIGPNQRLYVVDHEGARIQIFDLDGKFIGKFGGAGAGNGKFNHPWGIGVAKNGRVYVADRENHRVQIFDADGNFLSTFGGEGSFFGQFKRPHGLAICPDGSVAVADADNNRIQYFDASGIFLRKVDWPRGGGVHRITASSDGLTLASGERADYWNGGPSICVFSQSGDWLKEWATPWCPLSETATGDLVTAGNGAIRLWKRTYRLALPEPGNALPLPSILSQGRRPGTSLVDVEYAVKDADNATVQTAALAFKNGGNTLNDVIPINSFAEGSGAQLGANISTGQTHRFTWDVAKDWSTDFGEVQLEILAKDARGLLNIDFLQIPESETLGTGTLAGTYSPVLKISKSPLNDNDFLSVWYWLIATGDPDIRLGNGVIYPASISNTFSYDGTNGVPGLVGSYYLGMGFQGAPTERIDSYINIRPAASSSSLDAPFQSEQMSVKWEGKLLPDVTGPHLFFFTTDDGVRVWINNQLIVDSWRPQGPTEYAGAIDLTAGAAVPIRVEYYDQGGWRAAQLSWQPPGKDKALVPPTNLFTGVTASPGSISYTPSGGEFASGASTTAAGRTFIFNKMGLREATSPEITRAQEAGTPGVINRWTPKIQVGPGERPAAVNSYGFDTGASGYWVVPVTSK